MQKEHTIIVGGGPCGMACALELQEHGITPLIIEKENVVNTLYNFPTHQTFFSSSEKLEIGGIPFITERQKPVRNQALAYYRSVARRENLRINAYEKVQHITSDGSEFSIRTVKIMAKNRNTLLQMSLLQPVIMISLIQWTFPVKHFQK